MAKKRAKRASRPSPAGKSGKTGRLGRFLVALAKEPRKLAAFWENPARFVRGADLSDEEKAALVGRDREAITRLLGEGATAPAPKGVPGIFVPGIFAPGVFIGYDLFGKGAKARPKAKRKAKAGPRKRG